ncbi:MAG: hypothetical protein ACD_62C00620G0002 [uncultured bacterium]|nr:MAG: hypothetical protein ACD_62C00620G0002 [uncultured bacterium]HLD43911.1 hypothetical protein [bacterium]
MQLIELIQARIESLYGIKIGAKAGDYLIGEDELFELLPAHQQTVVPKELFLVNPDPDNDTVEVALFLDSKLKENLSHRNPLERLCAENIGDFCALIEGISHFVCYLHKAHLNREITQLELELQAEIDKFLLLSLLTYSDEANSYQLIDVLFEGYAINEALALDQIERYETASTLAKKYCASLACDIKARRIKNLVKKIREFYSLSQEEKIRMIVC